MCSSTYLFSNVSSLFFNELDELLEQWVLAEQGLVAGDEELAAGTGECYVQLAVDDVTVFHEAGGGEEIQLPRALRGERIDDDVALRTLIALHGVDGDVGKWRDAEGFRFLAEAGADFVKTSTGFSTGGARAEDVALMKKSIEVMNSGWSWPEPITI